MDEEFVVTPKVILAGLGIVTAAGLGLGGFFSSYYSIPTGSVGVETRFGQYRQTTNPGPHFKAPFGIDKVEEISLERVHVIYVGLRPEDTDREGNVTDWLNWGESEEMLHESQMLTADENIAQVTGVVQYYITDPLAWTFNNDDPEAIVKDATDAAFRQVIGDHGIDEALTIGKENIQYEMRRMLQALIDDYDIGVNISNVLLQDVDPPAAVAGAFSNVQTQKELSQAKINLALAYRNSRLTEVEGEAKAKIQDAEGYRATRVNTALGDIAQFRALLEQYENAPESTALKLYLETMEEIYPHLDKFIIDGSLGGDSLDDALRLQMLKILEED